MHGMLTQVSRDVGSNKKNTKVTDDNDMLNELNMAANSLSLIESL